MQGHAHRYVFLSWEGSWIYASQMFLKMRLGSFDCIFHTPLSFATLLEAFDSTRNDLLVCLPGIFFQPKGGWSKTDKLIRPFCLLLQTSTKWWQLIAVVKDFLKRTWYLLEAQYPKNIPKKTRTSRIALRLFHPFLVSRSNYHFVNSFWIYEHLLMSRKKCICLNLRILLHSYKIVWSVCNSGNPYLEIISLRNETERGCIHFGGNLCSGFLQCYPERSCGVLCLPMIHGGSSYEKWVVNNHG